MRRPWTDKELIRAVETSTSIAEVLRKICKKPTGGNYTHVKGVIRKLGLSTGHFTGQGHLKGKRHNWTKAIPLDDILVKDSTYPSAKLRRRLIKQGVIENKCATCGINEWLGTPLVLHLDHVNGDHYDNRLQNLRLLCPNCHSQTETYAGKNKRST